MIYISKKDDIDWSGQFLRLPFSLIVASYIAPPMRSHLNNEKVQLTKEFTEKIGEDLGISGVQEVWEASKEGEAFKLLAEKNFRSPGFVDKEADRLYLRPPYTPHKVLADAVDDIIEMMLEKNGHVFFTDNVMVKDYKRVALITRY